MVCPECGLDHEEGSTLCADCGVELIEEEAEDSEVEDVEFVALGEVTDVGVFAAVTAQLEDAGIPWFVQSEKGPMAMVYVDRNRLAEARREMEAVAPMAVCENE
ncbi:MAG: hypothetical protein QOF89_2288 [Acidobacteriota bacterium]|jgi:transcription initiation factor TFIIIB Brf1 subunit/transcription initiation factor TFIIB|nr:hypothetical protein [Acidobacteriota bacterium]